MANFSWNWVETEDDSSLSYDEYDVANALVSELVESLPDDATDIFKTIFVGDKDEDGPIIVVYSIVNNTALQVRYFK